MGDYKDFVFIIIRGFVERIRGVDQMREKVLIVDDIELNREILAVALGDEYDIIQASDGEKTIEILEENRDDISAMLLDLIMPNVDGYAVLEYMRDNGLMDRIPVIVISAESARDVEVKCLDMGVTDFVRKPFDSVTVRRRVKNVADLFMYKNNLEAKVKLQTRDLIEKNKLLQAQAEKIRETNEKIVDVLGTVVEYRNLESGEHIKRVKGFTRILAEKAAERYPEYGLTQEKIEVIVSASALHDVGKISIKDSVLLKPGKLTREEFEYMKTHTTKGCEILTQIAGTWSEDYEKVSYEICRHHHERYDGKGYPDGLVGEQIPISAQLVSIADVYDALVSERVYKKAIAKDKAFQMILDGECGTFSPRLIECFKESRQAFEELACRYEMKKAEA